jgi:hypothetical protein
MQLSRVNDIGGCRAVLASVDHVYDLQRALLEQTRASWELTHLPSKYDYVARPKDSGYRSVHLVYAYQSDSEEHADFDGQRIEIQLRSKLQHSWATANEIAETFTGLPLKSYRGAVAPHDAERFAGWKRFFVLASGVFAYLEGKSPVPDTPDRIGPLRDDLRRVDDAISAYHWLKTWRTVVKDVCLPAISTHGEHIKRFLLTMKKVREDCYSLTVLPFAEDRQFTAFDAYVLAERANNAVLVSISSDSLKDLQTAYPNYYADATSFLETIRPYLLNGVMMFPK